MRLRMRARVGVVVAAVSAAVLAGCGGSDAPEGSPAPSAATSSAAPSAPALPAAAEGQGPRAAEAFVRHYVDLINHGLETLDERPLVAESTQDCDLCRGFARILAGVDAKGGSYEGGQWGLRGIERRPHGVPGEYNFRALIRVSEETIRYPDDEDATHPQREAYFNFIVRENDAGFAMIRIIGGAQ
jgi:hypothetical protein